MPFGGFMARYAMEEVYTAIKQAGTTLVFVNTRAQAELVFQMPIFLISSLSVST